jgi:hypothetical protein
MMPSLSADPLMPPSASGDSSSCTSGWLEEEGDEEGSSDGVCCSNGKGKTGGGRGVR